MTYLVMEVHPAYAVVMDEEGRFLKAASLGYQVGDTVMDIVELKEEPRTRRGNAVVRSLGSLAAVAACFCLLFLGVYRVNFMSYGTVRIKINPDVLLTITRSDRVIDLKGLNLDGDTLIDGYVFKGKSKSVVADELADRAVEMGFLKVGKEIRIAVNSRDQSWKQTAEQDILDHMQKHFQDSDILVKVDESLIQDGDDFDDQDDNDDRDDDGDFDDSDGDGEDEKDDDSDDDDKEEPKRPQVPDAVRRGDNPARQKGYDVSGQDDDDKDDDERDSSDDDADDFDGSDQDDEDEKGDDRDDDHDDSDDRKEPNRLQDSDAVRRASTPSRQEDLNVNRRDVGDSDHQDEEEQDSDDDGDDDDNERDGHIAGQDDDDDDRDSQTPRQENDDDHDDDDD